MADYFKLVFCVYLFKDLVNLMRKMETVSPVYLFIFHDSGLFGKTSFGTAVCMKLPSEGIELKLSIAVSPMPYSRSYAAYLCRFCSHTYPVPLCNENKIYNLPDFTVVAQYFLSNNFQ